MTVMATTDLTDYTSGLCINKSVSLIEEFGMYTIITGEYKPGFFGYKDVNVIDTFTSYRRAVKCYIEHGGQMRREF